MNTQGRYVHRGGATKHSTAHAACSVWLAKNPGLKAFGEAWTAFFSEHMDKADPRLMFDRQGWTGSGADATDKDAARIPAGGQFETEEAEEPSGSKAEVEKKPAAAPEKLMKKPAAAPKKASRKPRKEGAED